MCLLGDIRPHVPSLLVFTGIAFSEFGSILNATEGYPKNYAKGLAKLAL